MSEQKKISFLKRGDCKLENIVALMYLKQNWNITLKG